MEDLNISDVLEEVTKKMNSLEYPISRFANYKIENSVADFFGLMKNEILEIVGDKDFCISAGSIHRNSFKEYVWLGDFSLCTHLGVRVKSFRARIIVLGRIIKISRILITGIRADESDSLLENVERVQNEVEKRKEEKEKRENECLEKDLLLLKEKGFDSFEAFVSEYKRFYDIFQEFSFFSQSDADYWIKRGEV